MSTVRIILAAVGSLALLPVAAAQEADTGGQSPAAQTEVAFVMRIAADPLFTSDGERSDRADPVAARLASRLNSLTEAGEAFAIAPSPVLCDEATLSDGEGAKELTTALQELGDRVPVLASPYADARLPGLGTRNTLELLEQGREELSRCMEAEVASSFFTPDLRLDAAAIEALKKAGASSTFQSQTGGGVIDDIVIIPALEIDDPSAPATSFAEGVVVTRRVAVVIDVAKVDPAPLLAVAAADTRINIVTVAELAEGLSPLPTTLADEPEPPHLLSVKRAADAVERLASYTDEDNELVAVLRTVVARVASSAEWDGEPEVAEKRAEGVASRVRRERDRIDVEDGEVTFTSERGSLPVTISNQTNYPVRVRVTVGSLKLDFPDGNSRIVKVEPPGRTVTFDAVARSTGTFPTQVSATSPTGTVSFGSAEVRVRSTAANISALVLTLGGAAFFIVWSVRRVRRRSGP